MAVERATITIWPDVVEQVARRGRERSTQINTMLRRYATLMREERGALRQMLDEREMALILDACNGTMFLDEFAIRMIAQGIEDAIDLDLLDKKWGVDGTALLDKLNGLSTSRRYALVDAAQAWWERVGQGEQPKWGEMLDWSRERNELLAPDLE